jgi:hypothetical protein
MVYLVYWKAVAATFGSMSCNLSGQMTATGHFSLRPLYCMTPRFDLELPCLLFFGERRRQLGQGLSDSPAFTRTAVVFFAPWSKDRMVPPSSNLVPSKEKMVAWSL